MRRGNACAKTPEHLVGAAFYQINYSTQIFTNTQFNCISMMRQGDAISNSPRYIRITTANMDDTSMPDCTKPSGSLQFGKVFSSYPFSGKAAHLAGMYFTRGHEAAFQDMSERVY